MTVSAVRYAFVARQVRDGTHGIMRQHDPPTNQQRWPDIVFAKREMSAESDWMHSEGPGSGTRGGGQADQPLHAHDGVAAIRPGARVRDVQVVPPGLGGVLRIAHFDPLAEGCVRPLHDTYQRVRESGSQGARRG